MAKSQASNSEISIPETVDPKMAESKMTESERAKSETAEEQMVESKMAELQTAKPKKMLCLMIVNHSEFKDTKMNRSDAIEPARELKSALEKCCACDIKLKENLEAKQMQSAVADVVDGRTANLADYDSVWLVVSSHGDWEHFPNSKNPKHQADVIWGTDTTIPIFLLTKHLQKTGKPCAIVMQACRGDQLAAVCKMKVDEKGDVISSEVTKKKVCGSDRDRTENTWPEINSYFDNQIMLCSSLPGNISFRRGLFDYLTQVLQDEDLKKTDVDSLFATTCKKVAEEFSSNSDNWVLLNRKVVAVFYNKLRSELFLK